jgi:hypothetical protein
MLIQLAKTYTSIYLYRSDIFHLISVFKLKSHISKTECKYKSAISYIRLFSDHNTSTHLNEKYKLIKNDITLTAYMIHLQSPKNGGDDNIIIILLLLFLLTDIHFTKWINTVSAIGLNKAKSIGTILTKRIIENRPYTTFGNVINIKMIGRIRMKNLSDIVKFNCKI